jgi:Holliday junction DNA helicase RuvA
MISRVAGRLVARDINRVELATAGGVTYELEIPLATFEALPKLDEDAMLYTHLVVRDDQWLLYGFATSLEQRLFRRLLAANGVGPALALSMLSRFPAERLVRAIRERDVATLQSVPRVGRKKAQQLVLDLAEKLDDLVAGKAGAARPGGPAADSAIRALVALGHSIQDAEAAVHAALEEGEDAGSVPDLIRSALAALARR